VLVLVLVLAPVPVPVPVPVPAKASPQAASAHFPARVQRAASSAASVGRPAAPA
jgi:hypothetical protein